MLKAVSAHFTIEQILPFDFARQYTSTQYGVERYYNQKLKLLLITYTGVLDTGDLHENGVSRRNKHPPPPHHHQFVSL